MLVQLKHQDVQLHVQLHVCCMSLQLCKIFIENVVDSGEYNIIFNSFHDGFVILETGVGCKIGQRVIIPNSAWDDIVRGTLYSLDCSPTLC